MGNITVFSNKTVNFNHPLDFSRVVNVKALSFETVPDWIVDSKMFKLLKSEGSIRIINSNKDLREVEAEGKVKGKDIFEATKEEMIEKEEEAQFAREREIEVEEGTKEEKEIVNFSDMTSKQLYNLCIEKGLNAEPKQKKEVYVKLLTEEE